MLGRGLCGLILWSILSGAPCWGMESNRETILILHPRHSNFAEAATAIRDNLSSEFTIAGMRVSKSTRVSKLAKLLNQMKPQMVVLMERKSFNLYHQYQQNNPEITSFPPCLVLMTSYVDNRIAKLKNATGIRYEIQGVTGLSHLRSLVENPIQRVGVLYSSSLVSFFKTQRDLCRAEEIDLVGFQLKGKTLGKEREIKRGLEQLIGEKRVDAIWVLNENRLLEKPHLDWGWFPALRRFEGPVLVGVERLAMDKVGLGQFAIVPDHTGLGNQAANMIFEIRDAGWSVADFPVRRPYSVNKKINLKKMPRSLRLNKEILENEWEGIR